MKSIKIVELAKEFADNITKDTLELNLMAIGVSSQKIRQSDNIVMYHCNVIRYLQRRNQLKALLIQFRKEELTFVDKYLKRTEVKLFHFETSTFSRKKIFQFLAIIIAIIAICILSQTYHKLINKNHFISVLQFKKKTTVEKLKKENCPKIKIKEYKNLHKTYIKSIKNENLVLSYHICQKLAVLEIKQLFNKRYDELNQKYQKLQIDYLKRQDVFSRGQENKSFINVFFLSSKHESKLKPLKEEVIRNAFSDEYTFLIFKSITQIGPNFYLAKPSLIRNLDFGLNKKRVINKKKHNTVRYDFLNKELLATQFLPKKVKNASVDRNQKVLKKIKMNPDEKIKQFLRNQKQLCFTGFSYDYVAYTIRKVFPVSYKRKKVSIMFTWSKVIPYEEIVSYDNYTISRIATFVKEKGNDKYEIEIEADISLMGKKLVKKITQQIKKDFNCILVLENEMHKHIVYSKEAHHMRILIKEQE
ncbi:hypothetical protein [Candidatus Uabimicrobium sp. HlEnr_7]|uniref:hypothetical protein n=1 Tax=Candidatus Uabimicrobium helgolandensis TaxID=3095367 RepID=UPI00355885E6